MSPAERNARRLEQWADQMSPALAREFRRMVQSLAPDEIADIVRRLERGDIDSVVTEILARSEAQAASTAVRARYAQGLLNATRDAVRLLAVDLRVVMTAPVMSPELVAAVRRWEDGAFARVREDIRAGLRETIAIELQRGIGPRQVAVALKGPLSPAGLTAYDARIVASFRQALTEGRFGDVLGSKRNGVYSGGRRLRDLRSDRTLAALQRKGGQLTPEQIDRMVAAYQRKLVAFRAETFARTAALDAANEANAVAWHEAVTQGRISENEVRRYWIVADDERLCKVCAPIPGLNPTGVGLREPFVTPQGPVVGPTLHPNCVLGDTLITASPAIHAVSERAYEGPVVVIETAGGKRLRCTPNHPILTGRGWVAAGALDVGQHVIRYLGRDRVPLVHDDHQHTEPHIQQIAQAFRCALGVSSREVPVSSEHFHGDGVGSDVAIVWAHRKLWDDVQPPLSEERDQRALVLTDDASASLSGQSTADLLGHRQLAPTGRLVGLRQPSGALVAIESAPLDTLRFAAGANGKAKLHEAAHNCRTRQPHCLCDGQNRVAAVIAAPQFGQVDGQASDSTAFVDAGAQRNAVPFDEPVDGDRGDAALARDLANGLAGEVSLDEIVRIERFEARCHVYNLETEGGWYAANGIITHNCRCTVYYRRERAGIRPAPAPGSTRFVFA